MKYRDLIGSIFFENFTIKENEFRTTSVNEVVKIIYLLTTNYTKIKMDKGRYFFFVPSSDHGGI